MGRQLRSPLFNASISSRTSELSFVGSLSFVTAREFAPILLHAVTLIHPRYSGANAEVVGGICGAISLNHSTRRCFLKTLREFSPFGSVFALPGPGDTRHSPTEILLAARHAIKRR
jgi:hypothetical protein